MANIFTKGIKLVSGFFLASNRPLDTRTVVATTEGLALLVNMGYVYTGMTVYVEADGVEYLYTGSEWVAKYNFETRIAALEQQPDWLSAIIPLTQAETTIGLTDASLYLFTTTDTTHTVILPATTVGRPITVCNLGSGVVSITTAGVVRKLATNTSMDLIYNTMGGVTAWRMLPRSSANVLDGTAADLYPANMTGEILLSGNMQGVSGVQGGTGFVEVKKIGTANGYIRSAGNRLVLRKNAVYNLEVNMTVTTGVTSRAVVSERWSLTTSGNAAIRARLTGRSSIHTYTKDDVTTTANTTNVLTITPVGYDADDNIIVELTTSLTSSNTITVFSLKYSVAYDLTPFDGVILDNPPSILVTVDDPDPIYI